MTLPKACLRSAFLWAVFTLAASAQVTVTSLTPSTASSPVGTTVTWTAAASDAASASATLQYQFSVNSQVVRAYSTNASFSWTPSDYEGVYTIGVSVASSTGSTGSASAQYTVTSLVTGSNPVVTATTNPLIALYSMPPCPAGQIARVRFAPQGSSTWQTTSTKVCNGSTSLNFYIAGMQPSTNYQLQHDLFEGNVASSGPIQYFPTGQIPGSVVLPSYSVSGLPAGDTNNSQFPVLLTFTVTNSDPFATDLQGNVLWYMAGFESAQGYLYRAVPGGTFLGVYESAPGAKDSGLLREWDLAGNVVRETNVAAISSQLQALGTDAITGFSHDAYRLPNGDTAFIATVQRNNVTQQGGASVLGDIAVVVDSNLQVKWWWNEFDHLPLSRTAILGETCAPGQPGCGPLLPGTSIANDWTHSNSLSLAPDGNLVISVRHQDWIVKLNYQNGAVPAWTPGQPDNTIVWIFGIGGNFSQISNDSYPTHQHDVDFAPNGQMTLFDNGNTRIQQSGGHSRGQAWVLDETHLTGSLVENQDLGAFSLATGAAELLSNGNYHFYLGFIGATSSQSVEYSPSSVSSGSLQFSQNLPSNVGYRSFRMASLYSEYPASAGQYFVPINPCRVVDTRNPAGPLGGPSITAGGTRVFGISGTCGISPNATAYAVNITAVPKGVLGFLSIWPDGQAQPVVSTLNSWDGRVKANAAIVPAGPDGAVDVYASDPTDVVIDVNGYFAPTPGLNFYPLTPCRVFDSRSAAGPFGGPSFGANQAREIPMQQSACSIPTNAVAYSVNVTAIPNAGVLGYLTTWPSGSSQPYVSTLNSYTGVTTANAAIVGGGTNGDISVFVTNPADVVVDIDGYFAPPGSDGLLLYPLTPCRVFDTRDNAGAFSGVLSPTSDPACGVPSSAQALVLNATVIPTNGPLGYLSLWQAGIPEPYVSTLNSYDGTVTSNMAIVPSSGTAIMAYASQATQLILDVSAYFAP